jgi:hypothetical protein
MEGDEAIIPSRYWLPHRQGINFGQEMDFPTKISYIN